MHATWNPFEKNFLFKPCYSLVAGSYSTRNIHGPATATMLMPVIPAPVRHLHTELNRVDHMFIAEDRTYFYLSGHTGISELCKGIDY